MKKIYLCAIALSVGSLSFGQAVNGRAFEESSIHHVNIENTLNLETFSNVSNKKAAGDTLWYEDFTGGLPATWSVLDYTGNNAVWTLQNGTLTPSAIVGAIDLLTPASGNYMLLYMDQYNSPTPNDPNNNAIYMDSYFQTEAIPLTNANGISVDFKQDFARCCTNFPAPETVLSVSTDAAFTNPTEYDIIQGVPTNSRFNGSTSINITNGMPANYTGDIYLRIHVKSGSWTYFWAIDDIAVVKSPTNDIVTNRGFYGFYGVQYTRIPVSQIQPMDISMIFDNIGTAVQTNTKLNLDVNDGSSSVYSISSTPFDAPTLTPDTLTIDSAWTPPSSPLNTPYTVTLSITSDSTDITPANNMRSFNPFEITSSVLAIDDYSTTPGNGGAANVSTTEYEAGNQFDIVNQNEDLYSIDVVTGTNTPVGTYMDVVIYQIDFSTTPEGYTEVWRSGAYQITANDLGVVKSFDNTLSQTPGAAGVAIAQLTANETYFAAVHSFIDYEYGVSGSNPASGTPSARHSALRHPNMYNANPGESFGLSATPMIRLNFGSTVGVDIENNPTNFSVFPNPSNGVFNISLKGDAKTSNISVKNVVGQTIINKTVNIAGKTTETISLSDYSKGVYFLTVDGETTKLIVE